jgi:hypothetical protein
LVVANSGTHRRVLDAGRLQLQMNRPLSILLLCACCVAAARPPVPPYLGVPAPKKPATLLMAKSVVAITKTRPPFFVWGVTCTVTGVCSGVKFFQGVVGGAYTNSMTTTNVVNPVMLFTNPPAFHYQFCAETWSGTNDSVPSGTCTVSRFAGASDLFASVSANQYFVLSYTNSQDTSHGYFRIVSNGPTAQVQFKTNLLSKPWLVLTNYPVTVTDTVALAWKNRSVILP